MVELPWAIPTGDEAISDQIGLYRIPKDGFSKLGCPRSKGAKMKGSLSGSAGAEFLSKQGVAVIPFNNFRDGLLAVAEKKIDAFVQDEHVLKYQAKKEFPGRVQVLPGTYDEYFVSITLQERSPLRKPINKALLKFMRSENWTELVNRYSK